MSLPIEHTDQVTPEWLTTILEKSGYLSQGKVIAVSQRQSLRLGVSSNRFHLELFYDAEASQSAPAYLFLKLGKLESFEGHKKEIDFYQILGDMKSELPIPHCFAAGYSTTSRTSYLLLQDLSKTHSGLNTALSPPKANCEKAIECLAKIHSFWWNHPGLGIDGGNGITTDSLNKTFKYLEECTIRFLDFLSDRLSQEWRAIYEFALSSYPGLYLKCINTGMLVTLIHGDAHLGNFMFPNKVETGNTFLVDWETWKVDFGTRDLASMMALNWNPDLRQAMEKSLLVYYYDRLLESNITNYKWEECWLGYRVSVISNLFVPAMYFDYKISPDIWWPLLENSILAFQDLHCAELLNP
jgi:thiamine kinase-like enzyme